MLLAFLLTTFTIIIEMFAFCGENAPKKLQLLFNCFVYIYAQADEVSAAMGAGLCRTRKYQAAVDASASSMLASTSALATSRQSRQVQNYIDFCTLLFALADPLAEAQFTPLELNRRCV